jgi:hypothetical protein
MDGEKFEGIVQEAIGSEPLKGFGLKLLGIGADKMVFETPGSDRKIIKVSIDDVRFQILKLLEIKTSRDREGKQLQIIEEHKELEKDLAEVFGQEHLLRNGVFRVKIPVTKDILLRIFNETEDGGEFRTLIEGLSSGSVLEIETIAETQTKAKELMDPEKYETDDFSTSLIIWDEFRDAGDVPKALDLAKGFVDRNFLSDFDDGSLDEKHLEVIKEILTKIIKFTKKTGLMMDIFGLNNITIFTKEDGTVDYHLLDVILPGQQEHWVKNIKDDPSLDLLRHYYIFYYSIKSLADKFGIQDNLVPEDLVYFKGTGIPTGGEFISTKE